MINGQKSSPIRHITHCNMAAGWVKPRQIHKKNCIWPVKGNYNFLLLSVSKTTVQTLYHFSLPFSYPEGYGKVGGSVKTTYILEGMLDGAGFVQSDNKAKR